jgi:hypothetical protein
MLFGGLNANDSRTASAFPASYRYPPIKASSAIHGPSSAPFDLTLTANGTNYLVVRDCAGGYRLDRNPAAQAYLGKPLPRQEK